MDDVAALQITRAAGSAESAEITARLLAALPAWFGSPEANAGYIESAGRLPALVARAGSEAVGILVHDRHFPESAEAHLLAVAPDWHRRGVGRALVEALVVDLTADGCRVLQVKTLGASHPDPGYARTRAFYRSVGFLPLEETPKLWAGTPCLFMVRWLPPAAAG